MKWKDVFLNVKNIVITILVLLIVFLIIQNRVFEKQSLDNYIVLNDSLTVYKNKNNELYKEKQSYILNNEMLKEANASLYEEYKKLKDNPIVITETKTEVVIKEVYIDKNESTIDSLNNIINSYKYKDDYLSLNALHTYNPNDSLGSLRRSDINMKASIYTNIIEKNKKLYLISRSDNPYLVINNVNGGFIDINDSKILNKYYKKQNKWSIGVSAGVYGIYGLSNKKFDFGPGVGLSLTYNFVSF
jgi:cell division protein FtsB